MATLDAFSDLRGDAPAAAEPGMMPDRRELALVAVERTRMPMVVTDPRQPDAPIVLANQAFLDLTGYTAEEVLGRNCRFLQGPQTADAAIDEIRRGLAEGREVDVELVNYRKDGSTFINQLSISPVVGEGGELLYHFGSQKDVTERRRVQALEETERRLLMEVDHRAMNAMAIVQSVVRMSRGDTAEAYAASILGRVDALARAHRLLARHGWSGAPLDEVVKEEVPPLAHRVQIKGARIPLAPRVVQPLALVLHELSENATLHGALSQPGGTIAVRWHSDGDRAVLEWREESPKPVSPPTKVGFGIGTIRGVIERQLGGTVKLEWAEHGLEAELAFPIEFTAQEETPATTTR
jgi:PAS domain S-box-containing protein